MASDIPTPASPLPEPTGTGAPADAFERLGILETFSYGVLYDGRAYRASRSEPLSLFELNPAFGQDPDVLSRLLAEIEHASNLKDPTILSPRGLFRSGGSLYVVSEAQTGVSLATAFEILTVSGLRLSAEAVLRVAGAVLTALDQAAASASGRQDSFYCHGFLTPQNIFIAEGQRVLVRGFGLWAGGIGRLKLAGPNDARYLTPSQNRAEAASPRADLFSLGTILFEAVAGVPAFDGPPDEEAVMSLRDSVEELKSQGGASLQALYAVIQACLTASNPIATFRSRLKTNVDTLFLGEMSHERAPKTLSLEDLLGRVRPNRPAVIKARSLALVRVETAEDRGPIPETTKSDESAAPAEFETVSMRQIPEAAPPPEPVAIAVPAKVATPRPRLVSRKLAWAVAVAVAVVIAGGALLLRSRQEPDREMLEPFPRPLPTPVAQVAEASPPPSLPAVVSSPESAAEPTMVPTPPAAPTPRPEPTPERRAKLRDPKPKAAPARPRRIEAAASAKSAPPAQPASSTAREPETALSAAPPPSVAAGAVVPMDSAGLVKPVLAEAPQVLRFGESGILSERTVWLQILVDERGRVRSNRVLRAESIPPGFAQGVERYLATLRFRPGEVGGVPVKVWIPYELRFFAP
ncbi:MAG TPA: protein kinase [Thermoanaerobaculia bacterium]